MGPKRNLDELEHGEFSLHADRVVAKRSRLPPTLSEEARIKTMNQWYKYRRAVESLKEEVDELANGEGDLVDDKLANDEENLDDDEQETAPSDDEWETIPTGDPDSDSTYADEDMMDIEVEVAVEQKPYDPTEGIYDAIQAPNTKEGTLEVMRQRTLDIVQILNSERSKIYPSLWLRSLGQILHAVTFAAENSPIPWELTVGEQEDFKKIASLMLDIVLWMPNWNKPNFPTSMLADVNKRFNTQFGMTGLLYKVLHEFQLEFYWDENSERVAPVGYVHDGFFDDQLGGVDEAVEFWCYGSGLRSEEMNIVSS